MLQFTLNDLWQRREVRRLTLRAYTELGGVEGALEHRANETLQKLSQADQDLCRRIFLHLVQPGEGTEDTKRRVTYHELLPDDPARAEAVKRVVGILADRDARLITTEGTGTADGAVEVAHEALIRGWGRLRQWIDADRVGLRIHRQLIEAAREWEANGRDSSFLYGGTRLAVAREWAKSHRDELNALEAEFLASSRGKRLKLKLALAASILVMMAVVIGVWQRLQWQKKNQLAHFYQADVWFAEGKDDKAIAAFSEAIRFDPKFALAYMFRGLVRAEKKKEYDKAIADFDQAIGLDPKLAMAYNGRGDAWYDKQAYDKAIADYDQAIALDPKSASGYGNRGDAWYAKQTYDQAIADYDQAIGLDPKLAWGYNCRGDAWYAKQAYDKAIADYDQAIALDPKLAQAYNGRGGAWAAKQAYDKAIADYDQAIALDPKLAQAYNGRGYVWHAKQAYDKAIADYDQAIALDPKLAPAYSNRGKAWNAKQAYDKAIADCDQAIALDPKNASAYGNRGNAWRDKGKYDKAIADYDQAIALDPKLATPYHERAWLWATCPDEKYRDGKKAVESATRACELTDWKDTGLLDTLAAACAEAGDFDAAINWQEKALGMLAKDDEPKRKDFEARLTLYWAKKPYRQESKAERAGDGAARAERP